MDIVEHLDVPEDRGPRLRSVRSTYGVTHGPADISPGMAAAWRDRVMTTVNRRKKLPSPHYVAGLICGLSALWEKRFMDDLKIVSGNPWQDVSPPKADKLPVKYATDEVIDSLGAIPAGPESGAEGQELAHPSAQRGVRT